MPSNKSKTKLKFKQSPKVYQHFNFEAIGTMWNIELYEPASQQASKDAYAALQWRIEEFDHNYSRFHSDSLISRMAIKAGDYTLPDDARPLIDLYHRLYKLSAGAVTPLIGQLLADAGYDAQYSLKPKELHGVPLWDDVLDYEFPNLTLKQPVLLDFGAAGKGYLVDLVSDVIKKQDVFEFSINAGGDILQQSRTGTTIEVGLEHPTDPTKIIGVSSISNQSICGSAGNRRAWDIYNHIMNPHTLTSPDSILGLWVVASTALLADAISTSLYFVSPELLSQHFSFEYAIISKDFSLQHSPNFPASFF